MNELYCEFINNCEDIKKLREENNKDLEDQYEELCTNGAFKCLLKEFYQKRALS